MQKALRLHAPHTIQLDDIPVPEIEHPDDAIVKVLLAGLCGSDLHPYRGLECQNAPPFVMGHELYGEIVKLGSSFASAGSTRGRPRGYTTHRVGMKVISVFSVSCLECEFCVHGFTSRCIHAQLLGSPSLPGAQAQYVRIPKAGGTLIPVDVKRLVDEKEEVLPPEVMILLADILPTGYFAVLQAFQHLNLAASLSPVVSGGLSHQGLIDRMFMEEIIDMQGRGLSDTIFAVIGLGPVGICALVALIDSMLLHLDSQTPCENHENGPVTFQILAIDLLESRRTRADSIVRKIKDSRIGMTTGQPPGTAESTEIQVTFLSPDQCSADSCHAVLEVVGHPSALELSAKLSRPFSIVSSVGVHAHPTFPLPTPLLYDKNLSFSFGRCPVRALVERSGGVLERRKEAFGGFVERIVGFKEAKDTYERFEKGECGKVCFDPWG